MNETTGPSEAPALGGRLQNLQDLGNGPSAGIACAVEDLQQLLSDPDSDVLQAVADSDALRCVLRQARRFAASSATVLLTGESGTGKEVVARYIHSQSARCDESYVRVNCAAVPENLFESELFGHERGAFTGATCQRMGRLEYAARGTLLLDEISEISLGMQAKLLRVLEEEEYHRVGGNSLQRVSARIIATTNQSLEKLVADGRFRGDLYYRLNILHLRIPPLRARPEDIPGLVKHFVCRFRNDAVVDIRGITDEAMNALADLPWPGNVRQLRNVIHRACVLSDTGVIEISDLNDAVDNGDTSSTIDLTRMPLDEIERHAIVSSLQRYNGNKTAAARHLGVTSRTLANKMKRYRELGFV